ncbi:MAG: sugar ABC transporter permease [Oscillospiraceae bacterium]|nr:sugar ABC transporter permease [Oscillospiraceae bacterium]
MKITLQEKLKNAEVRIRLQTGKGNSAKRQDFVRSLCFLMPSLLGVIVFFVVPFLVVVYYSVTDGSADSNFVFLDNFINLFHNGAFRIAAKNTLKFSFTAVPLAVILAIVLALLLEARIPMKSQFRTFFLSPMVVPIASVVLIWQVIFSYNGTLNQFIALFGADKIDWLKSDYCMLVITILFLWKNLGYNMILFMSGLANIPRELLEVANVEGASPLYCFFAIKMRYLSPTVLFVTILSLINSFKIFREVYLLTGSYPYDGLYMLQHFMNNTFNSLDYQKLSAAAVVIALFMVVLIAVLFEVEDRFGKDVEG